MDDQVVDDSTCIADTNQRDTRRESCRNVEDGMSPFKKLTKLQECRVRTQRRIPAGTDPFRTLGPDTNKVTWVSDADVRTLDPRVREMLLDYFVPEGSRVPVLQQGPNAVSVAFLMNHSDTPNMRIPDRRHTRGKFVPFEASRDIEVGEELTLDYRTFVRRPVPYRHKYTR